MKYTNLWGLILLCTFAFASDAQSNLIKLNGTLTSGGDVSSPYQISGDGTTVVYRADQDQDQVFEMYSVSNDLAVAAMSPKDLPLSGRYGLWLLSSLIILLSSRLLMRH